MIASCSALAYALTQTVIQTAPHATIRAPEFPSHQSSLMTHDSFEKVVKISQRLAIHTGNVVSSL
jgi:hypothetical protein